MIYTLKLNDRWSFDKNNKDKIYLDREQFKEQFDERIKNKSLFIEFSNPIHDREFNEKRICITDIKNTCCIVKKIMYENNTCYFNIDILPGFHGPMLESLINEIGEENIQLVPYGLKSKDHLQITSFYVKVV